MTLKSRASIDDLYGVAGKAEIVDGQLMVSEPTGGRPGYAAGEIFASLREYARRAGGGRAITDNNAFRVNLPDRDSFSPDAAFYVGPDPGMGFYEGAPLFAVEVTSQRDYGPAAETAVTEKRRDYFAAGTLVVWDVDLLGADVVRVYRSTSPDAPTVYRRGEVAEAEPAIAGWTMRVDELFG